MDISFADEQEKNIQAQSTDGENASIKKDDLSSSHEVYNARLLELRDEINKGWDAALSKRSVNDIIAAKRKSYMPS